MADSLRKDGRFRGRKLRKQLLASWIPRAVLNGSKEEQKKVLELNM
jgi:hypothetical protein